MNINKVHVELDMEQVKPYKPIARAVSMPPETKDTESRVCLPAYTSFC